QALEIVPVVGDFEATFINPRIEQAIGISEPVGAIDFRAVVFGGIRKPPGVGAAAKIIIGRGQVAGLRAANELVIAVVNVGGGLAQGVVTGQRLMIAIEIIADHLLDRRADLLEHVDAVAGINEGVGAQADSA